MESREVYVICPVCKAQALRTTTKEPDEERVFCSECGHRKLRTAEGLTITGGHGVAVIREGPKKRVIPFSHKPDDTVISGYESLYKGALLKLTSFDPEARLLTYHVGKSLAPDNPPVGFRQRLDGGDVLEVRQPERPSEEAIKNARREAIRLRGRYEAFTCACCGTAYLVASEREEITEHGVCAMCRRYLDGETAYVTVHTDATIEEILARYDAGKKLGSAEAHVLVRAYRELLVKLEGKVGDAGDTTATGL